MQHLERWVRALAHSLVGAGCSNGCRAPNVASPGHLSRNNCPFVVRRLTPPHIARAISLPRFLLRRRLPGERELAARGGAVSKVEVDQCLIPYAGLFSQLLEVGNGRFV